MFHRLRRLALRKISQVVLLDAKVIFPGITYTADTNLYVFNSAGVLTQCALNTMTLDYDPSTLALRGYPFFEARTNSIRNNTMVGAVAGVARNVGTPTGATRTASTTVVVASVGHNVVAGDMLTCSGADIAAYNGTFAVSAVVANVSFSYVVASSATDSATGFTYSVVSPGTLPTNWTASLGANAASSVTAVSVVDGIEYIDLRLVQAIAGADSSIIFESLTQIVAADTQTWTETLFNQLAGGATTNLNLSNRLIFRTAAGAFVTGQNVAITPTTAALRTQRGANIFTAAGATIARVTPQIIFSFTGAGDITLRIGLPQLELGAFATPVTKNSAAAVTRAAPTDSFSTTSVWNNPAATCAVTFTVSTVVAGTRPIISFDDTTANQQIRLYTSGTSLVLTVTNGGVSRNLTLGTIAANTQYKAAFRIQASNNAAIMTGGTIQTDASGVAPVVTTGRLGLDLAGNVLNGWDTAASTYAVALPNASLAALVV